MSIMGFAGCSLVAFYFNFRSAGKKNSAGKMPPLQPQKNPIILLLPLIGGILMRNCLQGFTQHHVAFFTKVGRMWMELLVLASHFLWCPGPSKNLVNWLPVVSYTRYFVNAGPVLKMGSVVMSLVVWISLGYCAWWSTARAVASVGWYWWERKEKTS